MKNIVNAFLFLILLLISLSSCNNDFLDRYPETNIVEENFFKTVKDLETFSNKFYSYIGPSYNDTGTDNTYFTEDPEIFQMMRGELNEVTVGKWGDYWGNIRNVNYMLENVNTVEGDEADINHYVGIARFFRAYLYYNLVKRYGDVPWYSKTLETNDEDLYKTQDPREMVVDSIMADLAFAAKWVKEDGSPSRLTRWGVLALQARIAMHEGTFRKYHSQFKLPNSDTYLKLARDNYKEIIQSGKFAVSYYQYKEYEPYESLFINQSLENNDEIIFYKDYDQALGVYNNTETVFDYNFGLSRDLMLSYLYIENGNTKPFDQVAGYDTISIYRVFENRDPRMIQTFYQPGYHPATLSEPYPPQIQNGGFPQIKFHPREANQLSWYLGYNDLPIVRYGEILLGYAECQAELGEINQSDIDITINELRKRVNMPNMDLTEVSSHLDPYLQKAYPNVSGGNVGAILEIRRERRVELACEGFRSDDLNRWGVGQNFAKNVGGLYIDKLGYQDLTGDGKPNIAIVANSEEAAKIPQEDISKYKLTVYDLSVQNFFLSEQDHGIIRSSSQYNKFQFIEPKYYLRPMNQDDLLINPNLKQTQFWN